MVTLLCTLTAKSRLTVKALPLRSALFAGCFLVAADVDVGVAVAVIAAALVVAAVVVAGALFVVVSLLCFALTQSSLASKKNFPAILLLFLLHDSFWCFFIYTEIYLWMCVCVFVYLCVVTTFELEGSKRK